MVSGGKEYTARGVSGVNRVREFSSGHGGRRAGILDAVDFDEAVHYFDGLLRFGVKLGLERFEALLARLGDPQARLSAIHIAGTKGKGSTALFASSILRAAGYKVGTYLSPYVYDLRERVQIGGEMIPKADFARLATWIRAESESLYEEHPDLGPTTEFEFKTALGFCWFAEQNVDYAVIEVGLGGRLDATNVLPAPLVSVITNIGLDHTQILGDTLALIAGEKAGIIKPGGVCVTGAQAPEALDVIRAVSSERRAVLVEVQPNREWGAEPAPDPTSGEQQFWIRTPRRTMPSVLLGVRGEFQQANAALAMIALDCACPPISISDEAVRRGIAAARIPGRLEIVRGSAPTVIVDAAHNAMAADALGSALRNGFAASERPMIFVVGMSKGHEPAEFLGELFAGFDEKSLTVVATEPSFHPREASETANAARTLGAGWILVEPQAQSAARLAVDLAQDALAGSGMIDPLIVVTGSFFTLGDLPPGEWQAIFEERGLNVAIPTDLMRSKTGQVRR